MSGFFSACDITGFLNDSIGKSLEEIMGLVEDMSESNDYEEREILLKEIREIIWRCNRVLK